MEELPHNEALVQVEAHAGARVSLKYAGEQSAKLGLYSDSCRD